jgi:hypothetical protein
MVKERKFFVIIDWNYRGSPEEQYEDCLIQPLTPELEEYDGYNVVGGAGADGVECKTYSNLEQAIVGSNFKPQYIKFSGLTVAENLLKARLIKKYKC